MKLKEFVTGVAIMSALGVGMFLSSSQVSASVWHKGMPNALKGTWRTHNRKIVKGTYEYYILKIKGSRIDGTMFANTHGHIQEDAGPINVYNTHYRYLGNHVYRIRAKNALGNASTQINLKWLNKHTMQTYWKSGNKWVVEGYYR
ncbi:hypothetical protein [Lentilactobacillus hilgardii]|uniref:Uncharacterized protein n=1 Tax=Lentilactobacillus hilgardii TaxID=1588 RepID=A0A6P1E219_LENHI|nr:hypothetical protein [Lentilactobacillus hilgardii]MCT3393087.1 hypothetical protein [Lentilactobacillus hilgardii]QHB51356.1 hypothetical protein GQR93_03555 [Lentilactobacillus hilgardii]RRG10343.1 MAG: hypothetical protein DUD35_08025 [Lactobacillus sp.]